MSDGRQLDSEQDPEPLRAEDVPAYVRNLIPVLGKANVGELAHWVHDADEETSGLYSRPASGREGLGYLPLTADLLYVHITRPVHGGKALIDDTAGPGDFIIAPGLTARAGTREEKEEVQGLLSHPVGRSGPHTPRTKLRGPSKKNPRAAAAQANFSALFLQNQTHLRSHAGDTGSVVWRSTVKLAATIARKGNDDDEALLRLTRGMKVIELGAGTGALPLLLASAKIPGTTEAEPEGREVSWVATDQDALLPLLRKNALLANAKGTGLTLLPQSLDWNEALNLTPGQLNRYQRAVLSTFASDGDTQQAPDLLLAIDVVYNESLFPPLLATLTALCVPGQTAVLVLLELRQADMVGDFIAQWLEWGAEDAVKWHLVSLEPAALVGAGLEEDYALFIAWRA